jgi:Domain of unknown function (DUF4157)
MHSDKENKKNESGGNPVQFANPKDTSEKEAQDVSRMVSGKNQPTMSIKSGPKISLQQSPRMSAESPRNSSLEPSNLSFDQIEKNKNGGSKLPENITNDLSQKTGQNFESVRIHNDHHANEMADKVHAKAFTYGNDIYFKSGEYQPQSVGGQELIAEEAWHTVQQQSSKMTIIQKQNKQPDPLTEEAEKIVKPFVSKYHYYQLGQELVNYCNRPELIHKCFSVTSPHSHVYTAMGFMAQISDQQLSEFSNNWLHLFGLYFYYNAPSLTGDVKILFEKQKTRYWQIYITGYGARKNKESLQLSDPSLIFKEGDSDFESEILTLNQQHSKFITGKGNISSSNRKFLLGPALIFYRLGRASWNPNEFNKDVLSINLSSLKKDKEGTETDNFYTSTLEAIQNKKSWPIKSTIIKVAQASLEAGWGDQKRLDDSIKKNNYFGHLLSDANRTKKTYPNFTYGYLYDFSLLNQRWPGVLSLYESGNITSDQFDKQLRTGKYKSEAKDGLYSYNPDDPEYGSSIINDQISSVVKRWRIALQEEINCAESLVKNQPSLKNRIDILKGVLNEINTLTDVK